MIALKKFACGLAVLALSAGCQAATTTPWACASITGYGLDATTPYGYQNCHTGDLRSAYVQSSGFSPVDGYAPDGTPIPYAIIYSGSAGVAYELGVLRASVTALEVGPAASRWGEAAAGVYGFFRLGTDGDGPRSRRFELDVDGLIQGWGSYDVHLQAVRLRDGAVFSDIVHGGPEVPVDQADYDEQLSIRVEGDGGDRFGLFMSLSVLATSNSTVCGASGCTADFSHTVRLSLGTGDGDVFTDGGFLAGVAGVTALAGGTVPEPASGALALLALAVAAPRRRLLRALRVAAPAVVACALSGCFDPMNPIAFREEPITLAVKGGEFRALRAGCTINRGEFTDRAGQMRSAAAFKFIAVSPEGKTIGEWLASCQAVAPNGTSDCKVQTTGAGNMLNSGGLNCPAFKNLQLVSGTLF